MISKTVTVNLSPDAEARPVAVLVQLASMFDSKVFITSKNKKINAKSIMGMMSLGFGQGEIIGIEADGDDEDAAVEKIANYIESRE